MNESALTTNGGRLENLALWLESRSKSIAISLSVMIVVVGTIYSCWLGDHLPYVDEIDYYAIAQHVVSEGSYSNNGIQPNSDRAPGLPLLMSAFVALGADVPLLRVVNFVLLALSIFILYRLCSHERSTLAGAFAAILVVGYPVLFYAAGRLFPQTLGGFLFVLMLFLLSRAKNNYGLALAGCVAGILVLTIPMFLFAMVVVAAWLLFVRKTGGVGSVFAVAVPAALVVSVWTVRNYVIFHAFVLVSTAGGATFLWGNSSEATIGSAEVEFLARSYDESASMGPVEASQYKRNLAIKYITENKMEFLGFYGLKVLNFFNFYNEHYAKSEESMAKTIIMALTYCPLLTVFVLRLVFWRRFPPSKLEWLLIAIYCTTPFVYAVFHTRIRYRLPYDLALIAVVAMFAAQWLEWRKKITHRQESLST